MLLYLLIAGLSLSSEPLPRSPDDDPIIYKIDSTSAPVSTNAYSFLEKSGQVADYIDGNFSSEAMNPPVYHDYSQAIIGNVVVLGFNGMSIPLDISTGKKWQNGSNSCEATPWKGNDGKRLLIICGPKNSEQKTSSVFKYDLRQGITGFFAPCFLDKTCWYKLQSKKGLLAKLPRLR
jgi:hypothetical protein